ncbi:MAG: BspA family leucine-rich repeat surface protein, partial [Campylobacterota bacterium]|nr:BspA family leucine-rich repeat surface protein [Campylobacterota bacterium]
MIKYIRLLWIALMLFLISCGGNSTTSPTPIPSSTTTPPTTPSTTTPATDTPSTQPPTATPSPTPSSTSSLPQGGVIPATPEDLTQVKIAYRPSKRSATPRSFDLSDKMPPVENQGGFNTCVGFAVGYYLKSYHEYSKTQKPYGENGVHDNLFSPTFTYALAKGEDTTNCSAGARLADALISLVDQGAIFWRDMEYDASECNLHYNGTILKRAKCYQAKEVRRFNTDSPNLLFDMQYFLSQGYPIVVAIDYYSDFFDDYNGTTKKASQHNGEYFYKEIKQDTIKQVFYHALVVVGYDDTRNAVKVINSWGRGWGNDGYLWIDYEVFKEIVNEAYIVEDAPNGTPSNSCDGETPIEPIPTLPPSNEQIGVTITDNIEGIAQAKLVNGQWIANSVTFTITFSQEVVDFNQEDIVITNGEASNFRGSGNSYQIEVTPPLHSTKAIYLYLDENTISSASQQTNESAHASQEVNTVKSFITTWDTRKRAYSNSNEIVLFNMDDSSFDLEDIINMLFENSSQSTNKESGYYYDIDWGDGTINQEVTLTTSHTYEKEGIYTVTITGDFPWIYFWEYNDIGYGLLNTFAGVEHSSDYNKLLSIEQWGTGAWKSMQNSFYRCQNMELKAQDTPNVTNVSDMSYTFHGASKVNHDFSSWDISNINTIEGAFYGTALSTQNYNQMLQSWSRLNLQSNVNFGVGDTKYSLQYADERQYIIDTFNWNI